MGKAKKILEKGKGVLHLAPTWVPRGFNEPGKRLRLHPDDLFAYGMDRGGICERWLGSVTVALNGPKTGETEGMSFVVSDEETKEKVLFADVVEELGIRYPGQPHYRALPRLPDQAGYRLVYARWRHPCAGLRCYL